MTTMTVTPASFSDCIDALSSRFEGLKLSYGTQPKHGCRFDELTTEHSEWRTALMRYEAARCPGLDAKGQVAFLVGDTAYYLLTAVAALYLGEGSVPSLASDNLAFMEYEVHWEENGESGTYNSLEVRLLGTDCWAYAPRTLINHAIPVSSQADLRDLLRQQIEHLFQPLIDRLYQTHRLSKAAQWRLVADALAVAFLNIGRQSGVEEHAREEALALIKQRGSPLFNRQTGFFEITLKDERSPENVLAKQHFRARGGCCRYYTSDAATYCSTCVLLPKEERDERLGNYLEQQHNAQSA
ncbi:(2Fe-2S)-binding protein [Saccharospirillum alexandrii]|uniref:(2Fe-2S)-binding protein n=1 Tax=Saccharospirillum alexandrii TaxID=2448477 RepID=UPI000FDB7536|nr:(2Fe-2S)-binding protein [Saccharospirillum alexandrii]